MPAWSIASQKQKHFVLKVFLGAKAALGNERFLEGEVSENETNKLRSTNGLTFRKGPAAAKRFSRETDLGWKSL